MKVTRKTVQWIGMLLTVMLVVFGMTGGAVAEEVFEQDGSKIEGIDLFWLTPDSTTDNEGRAVSEAEKTDNGSDRHEHLYLATRSDNPLTMTYQFEVSFSGQYDYAPGDIQITIPAQVWHARDTSDDNAGKVDPDRYIGKMDLSVPAAPSTKGDFSWQLINGNYVISNTKTIGATSKAMFQMSITDLTPHNVVDMSECDPITVHVEVVTNQGNVISRTSDPITAQIDTVAKVTRAYKATNNELYEEVPTNIPAALLENLPEGTDPEEYIYVRWYSYVYHIGNQLFDLDIEDTIGDAYSQIKDENGKVVDEQFVTEGILLGFTNYEGQVPAEGDHDLEASVMNKAYHKDTTDSYDHTVYAWSAYKKADFYVPTAKEPQAVYVMRNNIDWILTEYDAEVTDPGYDKPADSQKVTVAPCEASVYYMPTRWSKPTGHFEVFKYTEENPYEDWNYGYGLNQLIDGEDVSMRYNLLTVGFGYPWTSVRTNPDDPGFVGEEDVKAEDFGNLGWRQITEDFDTFFDNNDTPLTERDFEITYLEVVQPLKMRYQKAGYPRKGYYDLGGNIVYGQMAASQYGYFTDSSLPTPDLQVEYQLNGDGVWRQAATAQWGADGQGALQFVNVAEGITTNGARVYFPENTTDVRHIFVSNVYGGKTAAKCDLGAVKWDAYLGIDLKASAENIAIAENWFKLTDTPSTKFRNDVHMFVDGWVEANEDGTPGEGVRLYPNHPNAFFDTSRATIAGASYGVSLSKNVKFNSKTVPNGGDNDVENRLAILHYSAELKEQSNLIARADYDRAVEEGVVPAETKGIWYDLLPQGVTPLMDTIQLREDDVITAKYTMMDYNGTGRILLVVEADLTPDPELKYSAGKPVGYVDKPSIRFDAVYSWDAIDDFGKEADNYIAFESLAENLRYNTLGTITGQKGNPDDPTAGNNYTTPSMPADIAQAMTDLDKRTDESRFVYAKAPVSMDLLTMAVSGIAKSVQNDLVGFWTQGLKDQEQVTVYEGNNYTYRLRVVSSESTVTSDIVIYDTIENYHIPDPANDLTQDATKAEDFSDKESKKNWQGDWEGVGQWRGTLESVDLSEFVAEGVAPVLYYSLIPDLTFADSTPGMSQADRLELFSKGAYDLTDSSIWHEAEVDANGNWTVPADVYGKVTAVALDARLTTDGSKYVLGEGDAVSGYLHMVAPDDDGDPDVWNAKGAYAHKTDDEGNPIQEVDWDKALDPANNMYAFNNTRLKCVQTGTSGSGVGESSNIMIRNDYTRVGILPGIVKVEKVWRDQNNHDNLRPDEVTATLVRKNLGVTSDFEEVLDADGAPVTVTMSEENGWAAAIYQVDMVDKEGHQYVYSFREEVEGYTPKIDDNGLGQFTLTNIHPNEQIPIVGVKQWNDNDDALGKRPESIVVKLYCDGVYMKKQTVTPVGGVWSYDFGMLEKYMDGGTPHVYTVEEEYVPKYVASSDSYELLVNDYAPYGDLSVRKTLKDATPKAAENVFTFTIKLMAEAQDDSSEQIPLMDNYTYERFRLEADGETWTSIGEGTVTCSSTFELKGDEKIVIYDLPSESTYAIEEAEKDGFKLTGTVNAEGIIRAGQLSEAEFTNTYSASGATQFNAAKGQTGHGLRKGQHQFQIVDKTEGSATYGQVVRTAHSGTPTNTQDIPEGEVAGVIKGEALASFGQLDYTHRDDGKTFTYEVTEVDAERPGYTYDDAKYTVHVTVKDNGDGTMLVTAVDAATGKDVTLADGSSMTFDNTYEAEGEYTLKAWKLLEKRELKDKEFTFELYKYDNVAGKTVGDPIATAQNDAEGNVVFPAIKFDQDDVSLDDKNPAKYYFLAKESVGDDATVVYSDQVYMYEITVYDNNDGTLSFEEGTQAGTREWVDCADCVGTGLQTMSITHKGETVKAVFLGAWPVNKNTGKTVYFYPWYIILDENWRDKIEFCPYCKGSAYTGTNRETTCSHCGASGLVGDQMVKIRYYSDSNADEVEFYIGGSTGYDGERYYVIDKFKWPESSSYAQYNDESQYFHMVQTGTGSGIGYCSACAGEGRFEDGVTLTGEQSMPVFVNDLHDGKLTVYKGYPGTNPHPEQEFTFKVRFTGKDLQNIVTKLPEKVPDTDTTLGSSPTPNIYYASSLYGKAYAVLNRATGVLTFFRSSGNYDFEGRYFNMGTQSKVYVSERVYCVVDEESRTTQYGRPASNQLPLTTDEIESVKSITMKGPIRPRSMHMMFRNYTNLETVDLSMMDTSYSISMYDMFYNCTSLKEIDLSTFDTSSVWHFSGMFQNCTSLETANLCSFSSNSITSENWQFTGGAAAMFHNCTSLKEVYLGRFTRLVQADSMFGNCSALEVLDLSALYNTTQSVFNNGTLPNLKVYSRGTNTYFNYTPTTAVHDYWVDENGTKWVNSQVFRGSGPNGTLRIWHPNCTIKIDPNGGTGSDITYYLKCCECDGPITVSPQLYRFGYQLVGLEYNGTTFEMEDGSVTIPENTFTDGEQVKLTAVWEPLEESALANSHVITFKLKVGQTATFSNVSASTAYEVWEENPAGWVLYSKGGDSGVIEPLETNQAYFLNQYGTGEAQVNLRASKVLDAGKPETEQFRFNLYQGEYNSGTFIESVLNKEGGTVEFTPIKYTQADAGKTFTYTIGEVEMAPYWYYDKNVYTAEVKVIDNGNGVLSATVTYKDAEGNALENPPAFVNTTAPGGLRLVKGRNLPTGVNWLDPVLMSQNFIFEVTFTDALGKPWNGDENGMVQAKRWEYDENGASLPPELTSYPMTNGVVQVPLNVRTSNVVLYGMPVGTRYSVKEIGTYPGWEQQDYAYSNDTGVIERLSHRDYPESTSTTVVLVNNYSLKGAAVLEAQKVLEGRTPKEDEFTFQLLDSAGNVINVATNEATTGKVVFDELTYDQAGTYEYTIREVAGNDSTVEYSNEVIAVTVVMEDKEGEGRLTATITYSNAGETDNNTITNKVKPGALKLSKTVVSSNAAHAEKEFTFTLYLTDALGQLLSGEYEMSNGETLKVQNGSGTLTLKGGEDVTVNGLPDGASYSVVEAAEGGFTQKSTGSTGKIKANETAEAAFTNTYHAEGEVTFTAVKTLEGEELEAGEFVFELYDSEDYLLESVTNDAEGNVTFKTLEFNEEDQGEKSYMILEKNTGKAGVTYDETCYNVTLTITDSGNGEMEIVTEGIPEEGMIFRNTYSNEMDITATKVWRGDENKTNRRCDITLNLYAKAGAGEKKLIGSKTIPADAQGDELTVKWEALPVFEEVDGVAVEIDYSLTETVAYTAEETPYLSSVMGTAAETFTVINRYSEAEVALNASKTLEGRALKAEQFSFVIKDAEGNVVAEATNDEDGNVTFTALVYTQHDMADAEKLDDGTRRKSFSYTMSEVNEENPGIIYDETEYPVTVEVTEAADGSMSAAWTAETGDVLFTNSIRTTSLMVKKSWQGGGGGAIELTLYANDEKVEPQPVYTREDDVYTYTDLPMYTEDDEFIVYSAKEKYVDGFLTIYKNIAPYTDKTKAIYDGGTIINKAIIEADFAVRKVWSGLAEGEESPAIELVLYCNGVATDEKTPEPDGNGWYKYYDLPDEVDGQPAVYTVKEQPVEGYETTYTLADETTASYADNGGTITNAKIPQTGDQAHTALWLAMLGASAMALALLLKRRRA